MATAREIWDTLSKIDVSEHIEHKGGLSYLSWAWAWGTLMEYYPEAEYHFSQFAQPTEAGAIAPALDVLIYPDKSCAVHCLVTIGDVTRKMWLPVMDFRNKAISSPTSRDISDAKMRALVKCLAMLGLGHYIYAGEDLPAGTTDATNSAEAPKEKAKENTKGKAKEKGNGKVPDKTTEQGSIEIAYEVFAKDCKSMNELREWWRINREELLKLEKTNPEKYQSIVSVFSDRKTELMKEEDNGGIENLS